MVYCKFYIIFRFLGTNLKWGLLKYPKMRLKRTILFGFTDVLGNFYLLKINNII